MMIINKGLKKKVSLLMIISIILTMNGCGKQEDDKNGKMHQDAVIPVGEMYTDYRGMFIKKDEIQIDQSYLDAVYKFSDNSVKELLYDSSENIIYSPVSLYLALSALTEGSSGDTAKELFQILELEKEDYDYLAQQTDALYRYLYCDTDKTILKVSNSVWLSNQYSFDKSYSDKVSNQYHASFYCVDFKDKKTSSIMEDWAAQAVNHTMTPKVLVNSDQALSIMNSIYFVALWDPKFWEQNTKEDKFYVSPDKTVSCDYMHGGNLHGHYVKGDGYKSFQLDLSNGKMCFCLPEEGVSINDLLEKNKVSDLFSRVNERVAYVTYSIPKFSYGCQLNLEDTLKKLGINKAFDKNAARFERLTNNKIYLDQASQDTHIGIDETGITAAGFTQLGMRNTGSLAEAEQVDIDLNRPFLYQVISNNNVVLFSGIVQNPTAE